MGRNPDLFIIIFPFKFAHLLIATKTWQKCNQFHKSASPSPSPFNHPDITPTGNPISNLPASLVRIFLRYIPAQCGNRCAELHLEERNGTFVLVEQRH